MIVAKRQIEIAFRNAEQEVEYLHTRIKEGIVRAQMDGVQIGRAKGCIIETKKSIEMKDKIIKMSKCFEGNLKDKEVIAILGIGRNTFYKYKAQIKSNMYF